MTASDLDDDHSPAAIASWLAGRIDGATDIEVGMLERPTSGYSAVTLIVPLTFVRDGERHHDRVVVRKETPDPAIYPAQAPGLGVEVWIQHTVMEALSHHSEVPVAPLLGYEADASVLGAPFFVMGFVDGEVPIESPSYTTEGFFVDAAPEQRRRMVDDGLRVLARVHDLDWRRAGLDWLVGPGATPSTERQIDIWEGAARRELAGRAHPLFDRAVAWLRDHLPTDPPPALCWGDPRPGNMIWRDFRCVCATDFEAASIAPPDVDLGWWLMFDRWSHEIMGGPRLPGEPTREEQTDIYRGHARRDVGDTFFFEVFAAARYTAIVVRVMNRMVARGDVPADHTLWIENPAVDCLEQLMEEGG